MLRLSLSLHHTCCLPPLHFSQQRSDESAAVTSVKKADRRVSGRWSGPLIPRRAHTRQGSSNESRWARNGKVLMDCPPAAQQCIAASVDRRGANEFQTPPFPRCASHAWEGSAESAWLRDFVVSLIIKTAELEWVGSTPLWQPAT